MKKQTSGIKKLSNNQSNAAIIKNGKIYGVFYSYTDYVINGINNSKSNYTKKQNQIQYTKLLNFSLTKLNAHTVALLLTNYYHLYNTQLLNSLKIYTPLVLIVYPQPNVLIL